MQSQKVWREKNVIVQWNFTEIAEAKILDKFYRRWDSKAAAKLKPRALNHSEVLANKFTISHHCLTEHLCLV